MSTIVKVCPTCAPPRVEEKTKYYGIGECQACGAAGVELRGFSLAAVLEALAELQAPKPVCNDLSPMPLNGAPAATCVLEPGHAGPHTDRAGEYPLLWINSATTAWVYDRDALGAIKDGIERMRQIHRETPHLEIPAAAFKPVSVGYCVDDGTRVHPSGQPGIAAVPIADPRPGKHDAHEWDHESQTAKPDASEGPVTSWVKLKRGNDWGVDYFAIEPLSHGSASASRGIKLVGGEAVRVRLADGTELAGVVALRTERGSVSDHGHSYAVSSAIPEVLFTFHGQSLRVRIDELEVDEAWARSKGAQ